MPLRAVLSWRHSHEFTSEGDHATRITDRVDTPVPRSLLRATFAYRHRQLRADLIAHHWARQYRQEPLTVAVTGSSGLVGRALVALLTTGGHRVVRLVRCQPCTPDERTWDPAAPADALLVGVDAVVHLAGASIAGRFSDSHKHQIYDSRIGPTRRLAELAGPGGVDTFATASAIGYYGPDRGDEMLTEASPRGAGFLADLVVDWEAAALPAAEGGVRVVQVRTGIVQSPKGGTLQLLYPLFAAGLGGRLGNGQQWLSWIGIDDLIDVYYRVLVDTTLSGAINAVAPEPVRNADYTRTLARVLRRPALLPVPAFGPRLLLGQQGGRELAEASQRVRPQRLLDAGHPFRYPHLEPALRHLLGRDAP